MSFEIGRKQISGRDEFCTKLKPKPSFLERSLTSNQALYSSSLFLESETQKQQVLAASVKLSLISFAAVLSACHARVSTAWHHAGLTYVNKLN
jgi:hypothetical protein